MIYQPAEDSFLIAEQVKKFAKDKDVLDVGTGSGFLAKIAKEAGAENIMAIDINKETILKLKKEKEDKIRYVHSNLFDKIRKKFDLIVFNPPYLPIDKKEDKESSIATTGGKHGDEVIIKFLKQSGRHLKNNGIILLLVSSLTPMNRIEHAFKELKYRHKTLSSKEVFFEKLHVLKIEKT